MKYFSGDRARVDSNRYIWAPGRADDVLKVAGHKISNTEVEASAEKHPAVANATVIGKPDKVKVENIFVFAVLKPGVSGDASLQKDNKNFIRTTLGLIAIPSDVIFVKDKPKNKAGKPMRNLIKAKALGNPVGDLPVLANPESVESIPLITNK